jgi:hypothetical protein
LWEETSCTAMFSYSIARAVNRGWINPTNMAFARKGFAALCANITTNGAVNETCQGTGIGTTLSFYATRTRPADDMHGRGAVLLAGAEILLNRPLAIVPGATSVLLSWPAGIPDCTLQTSSNLSAWQASGRLPIATNGLNQLDEPAADRNFYRLRMEQPGTPPTPIVCEAESLSWTTNGAAAEVSGVNTNAGGDHLVTLLADGAGDFIEFVLTNVPAATYRLKLAFQSATNRAQVQLTVDGNPVGATLDQYFYSAVHPTADLGLVTFDSDGDSVVRLTVSGKHGASAGYTVSADAFILQR